MHTVNPAPMNKFTKIVLMVIGALFALCVIVSFTACSESAQKTAPTNTTATQQPTQATPPSTPPLTVSYDLPKGWEWDYGPNSYSISTKNGSRDGFHDFMKIESEFRTGTDVVAKSEIKHSFDTRTQECKNYANSKDPEDKLYLCTHMPEYKEVKIEGTKVYMTIDWCEAELETWCTNFAFAVPGTSNKYIMSGIIYDRADLYTGELATIINSLIIKQ